MNNKNIINIVLILVVPILSLAFLNILLPNWLDKDHFADWRLISSLLSFAGLLHLGIADGIYKYWLEMKEREPAIFYRIIYQSAYVIFFMTLVIGYACYLIFDLGGLTCAALMVSMFLSAIYSFSYYYNMVFISGYTLTLSLVSQSLSFIIILIFLKLIDELNSTSIVLAYGVSNIPSILISISGFKSIKTTEKSLKDFIFLGFPLVVSNLSLILFLNIDKIWARIFIDSNSRYAEYALQSSLFVASASISASLGGYLVTKGKSLINWKYRYLFAGFLIVLTTSVGPLFNVIMRTIIPKYMMDYRIFLLASVAMFYYSIIYASHLKVFDSHFFSKISLTLPILYLIINSIIIYALNLNFEISSPISIFFCLAIAIIMIEYLGGRRGERKS
jgi:hypothetical protein